MYSLTQSTLALAGIQPTHLHLITNHVPIFFLLAGLISAILAAFTTAESARRIALVLLFIGSSGGIVTYYAGQEAYKPVRGIADETGQEWLDTHMERAERIIWSLYLAAGSSLAALAASLRPNRTSKYIAAASTVACTIALGSSLWVADAGGKIRHPEIRSINMPSHSAASHTH